jgi:hypothetical protein
LPAKELSFETECRRGLEDQDSQTAAGICFRAFAAAVEALHQAIMI